MATQSQPRRAVPHKPVNEGAREEEMLKYWPLLQKDHSPHNLRQATPHTERLSSADIILTALVQLGIYHVGAERAFLSLFDSEYQYCVAEATSGTYLRPLVPNHAQNQPLELCGTATRRDYDVCNLVLLNQPRDKDSAVDHDLLPVTVVPNLVEDARFRPPMTLDIRHTRFHAAVPIRTRRGINIGVYSVVNAATRAWTAANTERMRDISFAISDYLGERTTRGTAAEAHK